MLTVSERGRFVATMRHVHVWLMETLAAWVPTTPEMEVKLLFGEHLWDVAQHADALGKRTFELRLPLQHSLAPEPGYLELLAEIRAVGPTPQRLAVVYDVMLPALDRRCRHYVDQTDALSDAPTVRLLERELADNARMLSAAMSLRQELPALRLDAGPWASDLSVREAALQLMVAAAPGTAQAA